MVNVGIDGCLECAGIFRCDKKSGTCGESGVHGVLSRIMPLSPWSLPPFAVMTVLSIAPSSKFMCELVHIFVSQLAVDLGDCKFS